MGAEMSSRRKALEGIFKQSSQELAAANFEAEPAPRTTAGPVRTMALSLGHLESETRALQEALAAGQHIQELDPNLVDPSFVRDRLEDIAFADDDPFLNSIRENGQEVPILVRPHPDKTGRYQVAYGHRRLQAARTLGIKVRAIVREFGDEQLVIAQGVENNDRQNLSYIERAIFARRLEQRGFPRRVIMAALSTDKTELSKLLSVVSAVPEDVVQLIGSAHGVGRRKWQAFATAWRDNAAATIRRLADGADWATLGSDQKFERAFAALAESPAMADPVEWKPRRGGHLSAVIKRGDRSWALSLKRAEAGRFGAFLTERLDELYEEFLKSNGG